MVKQRIYLLALLTFTFCHTVKAEIFVNTSLNSQFVSNTWMDQTKEWDLSLRPELGLEIDPNDIWAIGYSGRLEAYIQHTELFYHEHELYSVLNPRFGDENQHELIVTVYGGTGSNTDTFESVNSIYPGMSITLGLEPTAFLYWETAAASEYRWYYNNSPNSSLDSWFRTGVTFSFPSKTSITPRMALGVRYYPDPVAFTNEPWDMQLKPGIRIAQGIGETSGVWVDYEFLHTVNDNNLVVGEMQSAEMNFVGNDFMFSGHGFAAGARRIWTERWESSLEFSYQKRWFNGLEVLDETGLATGIDRDDTRVGAGGSIQYAREFGEAAQSRFSLSLHYNYLKQLSNDAWYDTDLHSVQLRLAFDW